MALFNFRKKKEEKKTCCCCCSKAASEEKAEKLCGENITSIKVLGAGCKACHQQYEYAKEAVKTLGISVEVEYVTDMQKVMEYSVMSMPAIVVNEKVVSYGKVLKTAEVKALLQKSI